MLQLQTRCRLAAPQICSPNETLPKSPLWGLPRCLLSLAALCMCNCLQKMWVVKMLMLNASKAQDWQRQHKSQPAGPYLATQSAETQPFTTVFKPLLHLQALKQAGKELVCLVRQNWLHAASRTTPKQEMSEQLYRRGSTSRGRGRVTSLATNRVMKSEQGETHAGY